MARTTESDLPLSLRTWVSAARPSKAGNKTQIVRSDPRITDMAYLVEVTKHPLTVEIGWSTTLSDTSLELCKLLECPQP